MTFSSLIPDVFGVYVSVGAFFTLSMPVSGFAPRGTIDTSNSFTARSSLHWPRGLSAGP